MLGRARSSLFERLSDAAFRDLMRDRPVAAGPRLQSIIQLVKCPACGEYLTAGARVLGQCRACGAWIGSVVR